MTFFNELAKAIQAYFNSLEFINQHKLWGYFIIPAILNLLVFIAVGVIAFYSAGELIYYFSDLTDLDTSNEAVAFGQMLLAVLIRIIVFLIYLKLYRYFILILLAPVLALMAEKLFELKNESSVPFKFSRFISNAARGIKIAFSNLLKEIALTLIILIMVILLPIISPFAPLVIFLIEGYYYGFSMIDYFNELKGMKADESRGFIWEHKGLALGNGTLFSLLLLIPFIGVLIVPSLSLVAAHLSLEETV